MEKLLFAGWVPRGTPRKGESGSQDGSAALPFPWLRFRFFDILPLFCRVEFRFQNLNLPTSKKPPPETMT